MSELNNNSYIILTCIRDKENDIGLCMARGMTKEEIKNRSNLSMSTINRAIKILLEKGYIDKAIKQINKKSYYVTKKGIENLIEVNKNIKIGVEDNEKR